MRPKKTLRRAQSNVDVEDAEEAAATPPRPRPQAGAGGSPSSQRCVEDDYGRFHGPMILGAEILPGPIGSLPDIGRIPADPGAQLAEALAGDVEGPRLVLEALTPLVHREEDEQRPWPEREKHACGALDGGVVQMKGHGTKLEDHHVQRRWQV